MYLLPTRVAVRAPVYLCVCACLRAGIGQLYSLTLTLTRSLTYSVFLARNSVAEPKQAVERPDLVEMWDVISMDP